MVSANKILTVSYGTFSCTLEGFDDSFGTMKAIAEYFRDLAAEDRYFGAEPPTPDAEMLQHIAEREIRKRVEARVEDTGIVLRTSDDTQAPAGPETALVPNAPEVPTAPLAAPPAPEFAEAVALTDTDYLDEAPGTAAKPEAEDTSVADRLARIRAVVNHAHDAAPQEGATDQGEAEALGTTTYDSGVADVADTMPLADEFAQPDSEADLELAETVEEISAELVADPVPAETAPKEADAEEFIENEDFDTDALLASLQGDDEHYLDTEGDDASDDIVLDSAQDDGEEDVADTAAPVLEADDSFADAAEDDDDDDDDLLARITDTINPSDPDITEIDAALEGDDEDRLAADEMDVAPVEDGLDGTETDEPVQEVFVAQEPEEEPQADAPQADIEADEDVQLAELAALDDDEDNDDAEDNTNILARARNRGRAAVASKGAAGRARARVLKVKRSDLEGVAPVAEAPKPTVEDSELSEEDEAALMAELSEVEAEIDTDSAPQSELSTRPVRPRRPQSEKDETTVSRLIETTNTKLEGSELRRRRSAIAHLKAAVAATVAERRLTTGSDDTSEAAEQMEPYRQDLAKVVRPTNTDPKTGESGPKLAPLMLVSEQRVDSAPAEEAAPAPEPAKPVRPRRLARGNLAVQPEVAQMPDTAKPEASVASSPFANYATERGVKALPELLEVAAAYLTEMEDTPTFSRPQVMSKASSLQGPDGFSREDGLRAFGSLLREGKIEKIKRGQFTISKASRFNPDV